MNSKKRYYFKDYLRDALFIITGVFSAGFGLQGFLIPNGFLDGGAMGISLIINRLTQYEFGIILVAVNLPFVIMGYKQVSLRFAVKTIIAIIMLALLVVFVPYPVITDDKVLIAFFGGVFLGGGIGLAIRGGSVIDGTEVLALYFSKRSMFSVGDLIAIINMMIFAVAAFLFSIEVALYAMLTYLVASKTVDFIIHGIEEYLAVMIISVKSEEIRKILTEDTGRGVTIFKGKPGLKKDNDEKEIDIIYTVTTRLEITRLIRLIEEIDTEAFIVQHRVDDTHGGLTSSKKTNKKIMTIEQIQKQ
jgi:uncharacterized membrane-anchored protein YitT (DUF2179 family)